MPQNVENHVLAQSRSVSRRLERIPISVRPPQKTVSTAAITNIVKRLPQCLSNAASSASVNHRPREIFWRHSFTCRTGLT